MIEQEPVRLLLAGAEDVGFQNELVEVGLEPLLPPSPAPASETVMSAGPGPTRLSMDTIWYAAALSGLWFRP